MTDSGFPYFTSIFNYGNLVESWYEFVNLLDVNFEEGFVCDECGPKTLVCDGTSLGFRRSLLMTAMSKILREGGHYFLILDNQMFRENVRILNSLISQ